MATNPMQKKSRNAFILGMLLMFVIAAIIVALLYLKIKDQNKELSNYKALERKVYVLNQDVESGQVLTADMFKLSSVPSTAIPEGATGDIFTTLSSASLSTKDGRFIYYHPGVAGNAQNPTYYYLVDTQDGKQVESRIYRTNENGAQELASSLKASDKAYYLSGNDSQRNNIEISENAVVAKIKMNANTVITKYLIDRADEISTDDLRKEEYNVISLPVDLAPGEYIDVRLKMPSGQNYVVVSKKKVSIPVVNGQYLADTIQMNLTEEEILILSSAIVESFKANGAVLYATRYTEAGLQSPATMTYYPSSEVQSLLSNDPNIVRKAINGIVGKRNEIRAELDREVKANGTDENIPTKTETSVTSTQEQRKNYLQSLVAIP